MATWKVPCLTEGVDIITWSDTEPTVCPNDSAHSIDSDGVEKTVGPRLPVSILTNPTMEPVIPGASKVIVNDRPGIEIEPDITGYGTIQAVWPHEQNDVATLELCLSSVLKESGTGTTARLIARVKAQGEGEDASGAWTDTQTVDITVSHTTIGEVFCGTITLDASGFHKGDAVALQLGRDGAHANDTLSVALDIISAQGDAL